MDQKPSNTTSFIFEEGEEPKAVVDGQVVASSSDLDELEAKTAGCPECGGSCGGECDPTDHHHETDEADEDESQTLHTGASVLSPNGLKGKVLGKVEDLWGGEEVTVRFENGQIAQVRVAEVQVAQSEEAKPKPIEALSRRLESSFDPDLDGLRRRAAELRKIHSDARDLLLQGTSYDDEQALDEVATTAQHELGEVNEEIDRLEDEEAERFEPPVPFESQAAEQESIGIDGGNWLDQTIEEMVEEANDEDYNKLMDEGPEIFTVGLDDDVVEDSEAVRAMASSFIEGRTAAVDKDVREAYIDTWVGRVEELRQSEAKVRSKKSTKQAKQEETNVDGISDSSLFT